MHAPRFLRPAPLLVVAAFGLGLRLAVAQSVVPVIPEQESPFFVLDEEKQTPGGPAKKTILTPSNEYPLNKTSEQSASRMFTRFFTDMFSSVHLVKGHSDSKLVVAPVTFAIEDRREVTATFTVMNRTPKLLKLDFPTSQRIEILVRDGNGKVIEKWSDDRAFDDVSGVVMINPGERIQYEERIATRDMHPGQTYTIEASMANNPQFTRTATVKPSSKPPAAPPNPTPTAGATPPPKDDLPDHG